MTEIEVRDLIDKLQQTLMVNGTRCRYLRRFS